MPVLLSCRRGFVDGVGLRAAMFGEVFLGGKAYAFGRGSGAVGYGGDDVGRE